MCKKHNSEFFGELLKSIIGKIKSIIDSGLATAVFYDGTCLLTNSYAVLHCARIRSYEQFANGKVT